MSVAELSERQYSELLEFRTALRRFNRWSEDQARSVGLTHMQHQLLLAIKGHEDGRGPTVGEVADYLLLRHHSAVELVNRAVAGGYVERQRDADDGRVVRLRLTGTGEERLAELSAVHLREIARLAPLLDHLANAVKEGDG